MGKLTTSDIQQMLATEPRYLKLVKSYCYEETGVAVKRASDPAKWRNACSYEVGSKVDMQGGKTGGGLILVETHQSLKGCPVWEFVLSGTDFALLLVEKDGKIVHVEDMSD